MRPRVLRSRGVAGLLLGLALAAAACAGGGRSQTWGEGGRIEGIEAVATMPGFETLLPLSSIFYGRITDRRFNTKATYDDPALREFFRSPESFADYYADLAEAFDSALFQDHRPTSAVLRRIEPAGEGRVRLHVHFEGENRLPLRWWSTSLDRVEEWEHVDGRWWIVPGKV